MKNQKGDNIFKILDVSPLINSNGITKQTKIYELNGEKFRIIYENSTYTPISWGNQIKKQISKIFNHKMCLSKYCKLDSKWNSLEDINVLNISEIPNYKDLHLSKLHCIQFFQEMEKRLIKIYS